MQYDTGDHVAVVPENSPQTVAAAAAALGQAPDQVFRLALPPGNPQQLRSPFPGEPHLPPDVSRSDTFVACRTCFHAAVRICRHASCSACAVHRGYWESVSKVQVLLRSRPDQLARLCWIRLLGHVPTCKHGRVNFIST